MINCIAGHVIIIERRNCDVTGKLANQLSVNICPTPPPERLLYLIACTKMTFLRRFPYRCCITMTH